MKKTIILIITIMLLTTGCATGFKDVKSNKQYTKNILCKPTTEKVKKVYIDNQKETKVDINELSECKNFKINEGGYEGLWTTFFVKPLAWLIIKLGLFCKNYGVSIMLIALVLRTLMIPLTNKAMKMNEKLNQAKPELDKLERKYRDKTDKQSMMLKSQEMMIIYQKYKINPISSLLGVFLQLPLFFAFLEAIQRIPVIFEEKLIGFHLGTTPWQGIVSGKYYYLIIIVLIAVTTYFSFRFTGNTSLEGEQAKQMKLTNNFMVIFITVMSFTLPTAIAFYWIVNSGFAVVQGLIQKGLKSKNKESGKRGKI